MAQHLETSPASSVGRPHAGDDTPHVKTGIRVRPGARAPRAGALALGLWGLACAACSEPGGPTGVDLTVRYAEAPTELRLRGSRQGELLHAPTRLPETPRALRPDQESVMLLVSRELDGDMLTIQAEGLGPEGRVMSRGRIGVTIEAERLVPAVVTLSTGTCPDGGTTRLDACVPTGQRDAGIGKPDARASDAGPLDAGRAGSNPPSDAGASDAAPEVCGNGHCSASHGENACLCPADCGESACGDGLCCATRGEDACSCTSDCGHGACGDGICCAEEGETACRCPEDCGTPTCGDGVCCAETGEDVCNCPSDCGEPACGDGLCCSGAGEDVCSCPDDCGSGACGDGVCCAAREDACSCPDDCGEERCGNGVCCANAGENVCSCSDDCGAPTCGDGQCCGATEDTCSCSSDCGTEECGNGECCRAAGENLVTCFRDCVKRCEEDGCRDGGDEEDDGTN